MLRLLPKADLHVHLDGSIRLSTLIELAQKQGVSLPSYTETGMQDLVFKSKYQDLVEYLEGFRYTCAVMQDLEALSRVAYEFAWDCFHDGVVYVEPRYSPELLSNDKHSVSEVILAIDQGLKLAQTEINALIAKENQALEAEQQAQKLKPALHPQFVYSHIICAMRMWDLGKSLETATAAVRVRDKYSVPIMALDLAGPEFGYPAIDHQDAYIFAHKNFMYKTVHAGEAYGPASIFQALTYLYADRIGHGFHLFSADLIDTQDQIKAQKYVDDLVQYIAERRITLEVCLTSNLQTMPQLKNDLSNHALPKMLEAGLSVALCTDNTLVSNTSVSKEIQLAASVFGLDDKMIKRLIMYGIKRGFYPGSYLEKKRFIDQCSRYYDRVVS